MNTDKQKQIKGLKYRIACKNNAIIKLTRWDKNDSHKNAILEIIRQREEIRKELKELENG